MFFLSLHNAAIAVVDDSVGPSTESLIASYDAALQALAQNVETQPLPVDLSAEVAKQLEAAGLGESSLVSQVAELQKQIEMLAITPIVEVFGAYVPYTGASADVDLNNKHLVNISHLGVGTTVAPNILGRFVGDNGSLSRVAMRGYSSDANGSALRVAKFRGTYAAPQVPQSGDSLGRFEFAGYATTSADGLAGAYWEAVTTEMWSAIAHGTKVNLYVTPNTTTTPVVAITVDQDKSITFVGPVVVSSNAPVTKTVDFTVATTENWLINNKSGSTCVVTMPAAASFTGRQVTIKNLQAQLVNSASSNVVPIDSASAGTAILLPVIGNWATMVSDGTNWVIMQQAPNNILLLE